MIHSTYAADVDGSLYEAFMSKLNSVRQNIIYYSDQAFSSEQDFKSILHKINDLDQSDVGSRQRLSRSLEYARECMKDSQTNLASEKRMLSVLEARENAGNYTLPSSSSLSGNKRPLSE